MDHPMSIIRVMFRFFSFLRNVCQKIILSQPLYRKFGAEIKDVYFEGSDVDFEKDRRFGLVRFMTQSEIFDKDNQGMLSRLLFIH
jgi:hypothetical protein